MGLGTMMQWLLDKYHTKYYELSTNEKGRTGWTHIVSRIKGRSMIAKYPTLLRDLSMLPGITPDDRIATLGMNLGEGLLDRIDEFALFTIYAALDRDDSYAILSRVAERGGMTIDEIIERLRLGGVKNIPDDKLLAAFMGLSRRTTHEAGKNGGVGIGEGEWAWREGDERSHKASAIRAAITPLCVRRVEVDVVRGAVLLWWDADFAELLRKVTAPALTSLYDLSYERLVVRVRDLESDS